MREVIENLYVGDIAAAGDHQAYEANRIDTVIQLNHYPPDEGYPDHVDVHTFEMVDGQYNEQDAVLKAVEKTVACLEAGETVLVHCSAGGSRSVSVCTTAAAIHEDLDFDEAMTRAQLSESINPHPQVEENARTAWRDLEDAGQKGGAE